MTIVRNLDELCIATSALDLTNESKAWEQIAALRALVKIYFDSLNNPPLGVIGVGAITYAEQQLIAAQNGGAN